MYCLCFNAPALETDSLSTQGDMFTLQLHDHHPEPCDTLGDPEATAGPVEPPQPQQYLRPIVPFQDDHHSEPHDSLDDLEATVGSVEPPQQFLGPIVPFQHDHHSEPHNVLNDIDAIIGSVEPPQPQQVLGPMPFQFD